MYSARSSSRKIQRPPGFAPGIFPFAVFLRRTSGAIFKKAAASSRLSVLILLIMSDYCFIIGSESARKIVNASSKLPIAEMKNPMLLTSSIMSGLFCI
jgi:hypothetical protein